MPSSIDIVVPTVTGREETLERCLASYAQFTQVSYKPIIVKDEETCGVAWGKGMSLSTAPYVHLTCDDLELRGEGWDEACIETADSGLLPCPIVYRPNGELESCGGDMGRGQNLITTVQPDGTYCDFTVVPFMSREQADAIGMVDSHYKSDVFVSHRGRQLGYETVVRIPYAFTHYSSDVKRRSPTPEDEHFYNRGMSRE